MSELLDERVVEMRFDNADFERNVGQSIKTINKLKESLDFDDAGQSFDNLAASAAKVDLSPMEESIEKIAVKFNMLELVAANVLSNIVNKAVNAGTRFAKSVSIDQVTAGWSKYQKKTESVQTIIAATGESIDFVNKKLEKLIWFADETSYDFVDMVNNIGKFTSAGIDLDTAVNSMMGISNWAAISGAGIQQASRAMYNLSQSIGMGYVAIQDWKSIELANMATSEFKETAIAMALELGTLKQINGEITTLDGKVQVTAETMRESLKKKWFTSDVLNATLNIYADFANKVKEFQETHEGFDTVSRAMEEMIKTGEIDLGDPFQDLAYRAFTAAQEAKTLTEAINATKDAVSSGWMRTFELIFGNYDQAKKLWTSLANDLYDIFAAPGDARNEKLADIMKSNYQKLLDEMPDPDEFNTALYNKLYKYVKTNRGEEIAQSMFSEFESIEELLKNVTFYDSELKSVIKDISKDNSLELKRVSELSHNLKNKQTSLKQIAIQLAANQFGADEETARKNLEKIGWDYDMVLQFAEAWKNGVEIDWDAEQKNFEEYLDERYGILLEFNQKLSNFDLFSGLREFGGRDKLVASYENIMSFFKNLYLLILGVGDGVGSLFGNGGSPLSTAIDGFYKLTRVLGDAGTLFEQLLELSDALFGFIIPESWDRFLHGYDVDIEMASLYEQTEHIPGLIDRITAYYEEHLKTLPEEVQNTIKTITGNVTEFFNSIPEKVKKLREDILGVEKEYINLNADGKWETKIVREGGIINEWKTQLESFGDGIIPKALNGISNFLNRISGYLFGYKNDAGEFEGVITWIYNKVQSFINLLKTIGKNAKDIFNTVFEDIKTFFTGGKYSFSNATIWSFPSRLKKHFEDLKNTPAFQEIKRFFLGEIAPDGTIIKNNIFRKISRVVSEFVSSKPFQDAKAFFFGKEANTQTFGQAAHIPGLFEKIGNFVKNLVTSVPYQEIKKFILGDIESGEPSIFGKISGAIQSIKESTAYKSIHDFFFGNEESDIPNLFGKIRGLFESIEASAPFQAVRAVIDFLTGKQSFSSALGEIKDIFMGREGRQRVSKGGDTLVDKLMGANGGILSVIFGGDIEHEITDAKGNVIGTVTKNIDGIITDISKFIGSIPERITTTVQETKNKIFQAVGSIFGVDTHNLYGLGKENYSVDNRNLELALKDEYKNVYKTISDIISEYGSLNSALDAGIFNDYVDISVNGDFIDDDNFQLLLKDEFQNKYDSLRQLYLEFGGDINALLESGILKEGVNLQLVGDYLYAEVSSIIRQLPHYTDLEGHIDGWIDNIFGGFIGNIRSKLPNFKEGLLELLGSGVGLDEGLYLLDIKDSNLQKNLIQYYDKNWETLYNAGIETYDDYLSALKSVQKGDDAYSWLYQDVSASVFDKSLLPFKTFYERFKTYIDLYLNLFKYGYTGNIDFYRRLSEDVEKLLGLGNALGEDAEEVDVTQSAFVKLGAIVNSVREFASKAKDKIIEFGTAAFGALNNARKWLGLDWDFVKLEDGTSKWQRIPGAIDNITKSLKAFSSSPVVVGVKEFLFGNKEKGKDNIFGKISKTVSEFVTSKPFQDVKTFFFGEIAPDGTIIKNNIFGKISRVVSEFVSSKPFQDVKRFFLGEIAPDGTIIKNNIFGKISRVVSEFVTSKPFQDVKTFFFGKEANTQTFGQASHIPGIFEKISKAITDIVSSKEFQEIKKFFFGEKASDGTIIKNNIFGKISRIISEFISINSGFANFHDFIFGNQELKQDNFLTRTINFISSKFEELKRMSPLIQEIHDFIEKKFHEIYVLFNEYDIYNPKMLEITHIPGKLEPIKNAVEEFLKKLKDLNPFKNNAKKQKGFFEIIGDFFKDITKFFTGIINGIRFLMRVPRLIHNLLPIFGGIAILLLGIGGLNIGHLEIQSPLGNMVDMLTDVVKSVAIIAGLIVGLSVYLRFLDLKGWACLAAAAVIIGAITWGLVRIAKEINGDDKKEKSGVIEGFQNAANMYFMISFIQALTLLIAALAISIAGLSFVAALTDPWYVIAAAAAVGAVIAAVGFAIKLMNDSFDKSKDVKGKLHTHAGELFGLAFVLFSIANLLSTIVIAFSWLYFLTKGKTIKDFETPLVLIGGILTAITVLIAVMGRVIKSISKAGGISKKSLAALGSLEAFIIILTHIVWVMSLTNNWESIAASFLGISAVLWSIAGLMKILSTIKDVNTNVIWSVVGILVALAAVTGVIALAIGSGITIKDFNEYAKYIAGIALLGVLLAEYAWIFKYVNKQLDGIKLDFVGKLIGLTAAIIAFAAVMNLISVLGTEMADFGAALKMMEMLALFGVLLVENAWIFKYVNKQLDGIKLDFVGKLIGLTAAIIAFAAVINLISVLGTEMADFGAALKMMGMLVLFGGLLSGFALLTKFVQNLDISKKGILTLGALAGIIGGLALLIWELSAIANVANIHTYDAILPMLASIGEVAAAMVPIAGIIRLIGKINASQKSFGLALETLGFVGLIALAVWGLAAIANEANIHTYDAILPMLAAIGEVAAAMAVVSVFILAAGGIGTVINHVLLGVLSAIVGFGILAGAVWGLAEIANRANIHTYDAILPMLAAIGEVAAAIVVTSGLLALAGLLGTVILAVIPGIIASIIGFGILAGAVFGLSKLSDKIGPETLEDVSAFLIGIARTFGEMFGAFAGGFGEGLTDSLPTIGKNLSTFMQNLEGFLDGVSQINDSHLMGSLRFAAIMLTIGADTLLGALSALVQVVVGNENFTQVGTNMTDLMNNMSGFLSGLLDITESHVKGAGYFTQVLAFITGESILNLVSALVQSVVGDENFAQVGTNMTDLITNLSGFLSAVTGVTEAHVTGADYLTQVLGKITGESILGLVSSLVQQVVGDDRFTKVGTNMTDFITNLSGFLSDVTGVTESHVKGANYLNQVLRFMGSALLKAAIESLLAVFVGDSNFADLASKMEQLASGTVAFGNTLKETDLGTVEDGVAIVKALLDLVTDEKYKSGGIAGFFSDIINGTVKFDELFTTLNNDIADNFVTFSNKIAKTNPENAKKAAEVLPILFDMLSDDKYRNGGITGFFRDMVLGDAKDSFNKMFLLLLGENGEGGLIDGLSKLSSRLSSFSAEELDLDKVYKTVQTMQSLFDLMSFDPVNLIGDSVSRINEWGDIDTISSTEYIINTLAIIREDLVTELKNFQNDIEAAEINPEIIKNTIGSYSELIHSLIDLSKFDGMIGAPEIGNYVIEGLINALRAGETRVEDAARGVANAVQNGLTLTLQIQSPSKVAYKIGQFVAEGLTIGLRDGEPLAESMARQLGEGTIKALKAGAERYDAYGLSQHAINMITEDLVDEHIFDMPDFSFTNRLGMEDIDFEAMRKFMQEKFGKVLDPEMINGFVNSYMKEFNELPKEIKDSDYAKVMTDIAKGEYGLGQDTIIDALEEELGSVSAAEQAWEDYNDVLKGNIKINKDLLKQKKENPPMTYEEYMAMVEHEQKGIELANKGFFDDFAKANGVTREEAMSFFGYDPKITQNALNQMTMNSQEMFDAWEKRITDQALADEEAKLLREWEQYVLGIGNTAADVNQKIETETAATTEILDKTSTRIDKSVKDVVKKFRKGQKLTEKEIKAFLETTADPNAKPYDSFLKALQIDQTDFNKYIDETKRQYGLLSKTEYYDKLDPVKLNDLLKRIQNGATEISKADSELLKSLAIATQTEGKFGVGVEGREKALTDFGIDKKYATLARKLASDSNIDEYIKKTYQISDANKEAEESAGSLTDNIAKEWQGFYSNVGRKIQESIDKGLDYFTLSASDFESLGSEYVDGLKDIFADSSENGELKIDFKDYGFTVDGKKVEKPEDIANALGIDNMITSVLDSLTGGNLFSEFGGLPTLKELKSSDFFKFIKSSIKDFKRFLPSGVVKAWDYIDSIINGVDEINDKGLDIHADTSEITQADNYLQSILDKYKLSENEETIAMQGYKNLINGDFINTAQKAALEKLWQGITTGSYGAQMQEAIKTVLDTMGISWDVLNSYFGPGGHSMLEQYTTDALKYAEEIKNTKELGTDYTIKDLIHDAHDKGAYGTDAARKKAWESMNIDYEKAMQVYSDYLKYGDDIFDKTKADARGIRYYAENYAFLTDAEIEALKAQERIDTALASTPEGAFAAIGDFLKGVNQVLESDDTAENFTKFVTSITDSMKSLNLDNAPAFKQIGDFLKMVQQTSNASSNITTDFGPMFQSIADSINSVELNTEQFQPIADFLNGVLNLSESAKDFINPFKELVTSLIEMPEGDASAKAGETARIIVETILQAFRERYDDFTEIGANFVIQLITGMLSQRDFAIKAANSVSTSLLTAFQQQAVDKASKYGQDFTTALSQGIASEESVTGLKNALNTLFGIPTEGAEGMTDQSAGAMASLGETFGKTFGTDFVTGFGSSVAEQQDLLSTQLQPVVDGLTGITSAFTTIEDPGAAITNFVSSIGRASEEVIDSESMTSIELLAGRIESIISSAVPDGYGMGWNFVEGLYLGLLDGWAAYGDMISGLSSGMGTTATGALGDGIEANSPSKATRRLGGYFVEGFMIGLQNGVDSVYNSSVELADASLDGIIDTVGIHSPGVEPQRLGEVGVAGGYGLGIENGKSYVYQASEDLANASMAPMSIMTQNAQKMGEEFVTNFGDAVSFAGYRNNPFTVISELAQESSTEAVHEVKEASDLLNAVQFKAPGFNDIAEIPHKFMTPLQQAAAKTITTVDDLDESVKQAANDILDLNETPQSTSMMLPVPENAYIAAGNALRQFGHVSGEEAKLLQEVWDDVMRGFYGVVGDPNNDRDKMLLDKINMTWSEFSKYDPMHNGNFDLTDAINGTVLPAEELEVRIHNVKDLVYAIWDGSLGIGDTIRKDIVEGLGYSYDIVKKLVSDLKYNPGSINWDEAEKDASTQGNNIGNNVVSGVAKGLKSRIVDLKNQTVQMVSTMTGKATEILGIQSPSKVFMEYGQYVVEGLAIGIGNNTYLAENSITDLSNILTNTFNESTISLADLIETDFNTDPVITPVIDMSNVYDSASDIDAMLSREQAIAISTSENAKRIQNGEEMEAVGATYNFTQNNYSPKALSRAELYRQTKNQFALLKGV